MAHTWSDFGLLDFFVLVCCIIISGTDLGYLVLSSRISNKLMAPHRWRASSGADCEEGFLAGGEMKHKSVQKRFMPPDKPISLINQCQWINYFPNVGFKTQNCNLRRKIIRTSFCVPFRHCWQCLKRRNDKWQLSQTSKLFIMG